MSKLQTGKANQNFDIQSPRRNAYVGGYQSILLSMRNLKISLSNTIRQIDSVAEESAAASEELSAEAASLKQLVNQFTLARD